MTTRPKQRIAALLERFWVVSSADSLPTPVCHGHRRIGTTELR